MEGFLGGLIIAAFIAGWIMSKWWGSQPTGRERPLEFFTHIETGNTYRLDMVVVRQEARMDRNYILYNVEARDMESWPTDAFEKMFKPQTGSGNLPVPPLS